jgi:hypothetical protein
MASCGGRHIVLLRRPRRRLRLLLVGSCRRGGFVLVRSRGPGRLVLVRSRGPGRLVLVCSRGPGCLVRVCSRGPGRFVLVAHGTISGFLRWANAITRGASVAHRCVGARAVDSRRRMLFNVEGTRDVRLAGEGASSECESAVLESTSSATIVSFCGGLPVTRSSCDEDAMLEEKG